jgi:L-alanine-DL-glutamate epimerase-like enolase superfamily enzyme
MMFEDITAKTFKNVPWPKNGFIDIPDLPGLGLELDMDFIRDNDEA